MELFSFGTKSGKIILKTFQIVFVSQESVVMVVVVVDVVVVVVVDSHRQKFCDF